MKDWPTYWKESVCVPIYRPHNQSEVDGGESHLRNVYMCFIDYKKAFDCVDHERLW